MRPADATLPDLEERPSIEQRQVSDWEPSGFDVADPSDYTKQNMLCRFGNVDVPIANPEAEDASVPF